MRLNHLLDAITDSLHNDFPDIKQPRKKSTNGTARKAYLKKKKERKRQRKARRKHRK